MNLALLNALFFSLAAGILRFGRSGAIRSG